MLWLKRLGLLALAALIAGGFYIALREKPAGVDIAVVTKGPMQVSIREQGVARVRAIYSVSAPIAGHLSRSLLTEGDKVEGGKSVVASIHPLDPPLLDTRAIAELQAARDAAKTGVGLATIDLQKAQSGLKLADDEFKRAARLAERGIISESALQKYSSTLDMQRSAIDSALAAITLRQAELASAEARLLQTGPDDAKAANCCVNLVAPVSGTVLSIDVKSEQAVTPGMKIAEIGDVSDLEIAVELLSADAVRIKPGTKAQIVDWGGGDALAATVRRVDPSAFTKVSALGIEEQRVNAVLNLDAADPRLGHNFRVFAQMAIWDCASCIQVPISALFRTGNDWTTFRVDGGRLKLQPVSIGHMNAEVAEVSGGLKPGDTVVVHPNDVLAEGSLIEPRE
ncbi:MAG: HlyD family efflux transporter periplasmic adaptor subunit [Rhizobiaceae bacterium]